MLQLVPRISSIQGSNWTLQPDCTITATGIWTVNPDGSSAQTFSHPITLTRNRSTGTPTPSTTPTATQTQTGECHTRATWWRAGSKLLRGKAQIKPARRIRRPRIQQRDVTANQPATTGVTYGITGSSSNYVPALDRVAVECNCCRFRLRWIRCIYGSELRSSGWSRRRSCNCASSGSFRHRLGCFRNCRRNIYANGLGFTRETRRLSNICSWCHSFPIWSSRSNGEDTPPRFKLII